MFKCLGKAIFVHDHFGTFFSRFSLGVFQVDGFADLNHADHAHGFMGIADIAINPFFFQLHPELLVVRTFPGFRLGGNQQAAAVMSFVGRNENDRVVDVGFDEAGLESKHAPGFRFVEHLDLDVGGVGRGGIGGLGRLAIAGPEDKLFGSPRFGPPRREAGEAGV